MSRSWKTTVLGSLAVAGVVWVAAMPGMAMAGAPGTVAPVASVGRDLWAAATIEPGREGIVQVGGYEGAPLGAGSTLTLTAPSTTTVTRMPFAALGYRAAVAKGGTTGTYTFTGMPTAAEEWSSSESSSESSSAPGSGSAPAPAPGSAAAAWTSRTFPFVLAVPPEAEPGTRLPDCALILRDADGTVRERGSCAVTVGLPAPTLSRPQPGVPVSALPRTIGAAYPGAQVTVRDEAEDEVCATTASPNGIWTCVPALALKPGTVRLQATATLNGVSATSEQINITVSGAPEPQPIAGLRQ